jgi:alkylmercury lyase
MSDCDCCETTVEQTTDSATTDDRWLAEDVMDAPLSPDMKRSMSQFFGRETETLDAFVVAIREVTGGSGGDGDGPLTIENLCHAGVETPHRATTADETYHFRCFYDGVALAHLADASVEIQTESPAGELIEMSVSPNGDIDVTPADAVMSFGIATAVEESIDDTDAGPSIEEIAMQVMCPYVKAFSTRAAYEHWAESVDGATVGMPLAAGMSIAAALTSESESRG